MNYVASLLILSSILPLSFPQQSFAENLCNAAEKNLFSCKIENSDKSVSLCLSDTPQKQAIYKFGKSNNIEISLPSKDTKKPFVCFNRFGGGSTQWLKEIVFPNGNLSYVLSTPQGISVSLSVRQTKPSKSKAPIFMWCDSGPKGDAYRGGDLLEAYDTMKEMHYRQGKCLGDK